MSVASFSQKRDRENSHYETKPQGSCAKKARIETVPSTRETKDQIKEDKYNLRCSTEIDDVEDVFHVLQETSLPRGFHYDDAQTLLHIAAKYNSEKVAYILIQHFRMDIDAKTNREGLTPLFLAVRANSLNVVRLLVYCGCDIHALNKSLETSWQYAVRSHDTKEFLGSKSHASLQFIRYKAQEIQVSRSYKRPFDSFFFKWVF